MLPAGHNMGNVDVPETHKVPPHTHDPLCHAYGFGPGQRMDICICVGIRIGRADEREQSATGQMIRTRERERIAQKIEAMEIGATYTRATVRRDAARIARGTS